MVSGRFQRRIDRILDQIEDAADRRGWAAVQQGALDLFVFDPENEDAKILLGIRTDKPPTLMGFRHKTVREEP